MGISIFYQAIPESSRLFERIQTEIKMGTLFTSLVSQGNSIYFYAYDFYIDSSKSMSQLTFDQILLLNEIDESFDEIAEIHETFTSRDDVNRCMDELLIELENAKQVGMIDRTFLLEKTQNVIEERLEQELENQHLNDSISLVSSLIYGNQALAPNLFDTDEDQLYLVPSSVAREGVEILKMLNPTVLFDITSEALYLEDFLKWRDFYIEVSNSREAVVVDLH